MWTKALLKRQVIPDLNFLLFQPYFNDVNQGILANVSPYNKQGPSNKLLHLLRVKYSYRMNTLSSSCVPRKLIQQYGTIGRFHCLISYTWKHYQMAFTWQKISEEDAKQVFHINRNKHASLGYAKQQEHPLNYKHQPVIFWPVQFFHLPQKQEVP